MIDLIRMSEPGGALTPTPALTTTLLSRKELVMASVTSTLHGQKNQGPLKNGVYCIGKNRGLLKTGVYLILNTINGKVYVGSAALDLGHRWRDHLSLFRRGVHYNGYLQAAWNKYGEAAFEFVVLERCQPKECIKREQYWMDEKKSYEPKTGYNLRLIATSNLGMKCSDGTKEKISKANRGKKRSPEMVAKMRANRLSEDTKRKISESLLGTTHTLKTRAKIAASRRGRKHSTSTREKMSLSMHGKKRSAEARARMSAAKKGKPIPHWAGKRHSEETRKKLSVAAKQRKVNSFLGRHHTDETKQRLRELALQRLEKKRQESLSQSEVGMEL